MKLPTVIATSIVRGAQKGDSHGGVYIVDLETEHCRRALDWDTCDIDWSGRGGARGLRGIALQDGLVYLAATDEIFVYSEDFQLVRSFENEYLRECHEICFHDNLLYVTSTRYDSVLALDVDAGEFTEGYCLRDSPLRLFDPRGDDGPSPKDTVHLNNVYHDGTRLYVACNFLERLRYIEDGQLHIAGELPTQTHNARPFRDGVLYNYTGESHVVYADLNGDVIDRWPIRLYDEDDLLHWASADVAHQAWGRGLCVRGELVITGYSPASLMVYDLGRHEIIKTINLSMDVRNVIHGLCIMEE